MSTNCSCSHTLKLFWFEVLLHASRHKPRVLEMSYPYARKTH